LKTYLQPSLDFGFATNSDDHAIPAVAQIAGIANPFQRLVGMLNFYHHQILISH